MHKTKDGITARHRYGALLHRAIRSNVPDVAVSARIANYIPSRILPDTTFAAMAVTLDSRLGYVLLMNQKWAETVTQKAFDAVLTHEVYHIVQGDILAAFTMERMLPAETRSLAQPLINIALDLAVNCLVRKHSPQLNSAEEMGGLGALHPETYSLKADRERFYYFQALRQMLNGSKHLEQAAKINEERLKQMREWLDSQMSQPENLPNMGESEEDGESGGGGDGEGGGEGESQSGGGGDGEDGGEGKSQGGGRGRGAGKGASDESGATGTDAEELTGTEKVQRQMLNEMLQGHHVFWESNISADELESYSQILQRGIQSIERAALRDYKSKNAGNLPAHLQSRLESLENKTAVVPWSQVLTSYVTASVQIDEDYSAMRPKRRPMWYYDEFGRLNHMPGFPGVVTGSGYSILLAIDVSGSMSNSEIQAVLYELIGIKNTIDGVSISVMQFDHFTSDLRVLEDEDTVAEYAKQVGRTACGGTSFVPAVGLARYSYSRRPEDMRLACHGLEFDDPATQKVMQMMADMETFDACIIATDGYAPLPPAEKYASPARLLWLLTPRGRRKAEFEDELNAKKSWGTVIDMKDV